MDPHRLSELRSIALHQVVALRLKADPRVLFRGAERVGQWIAAGSVHSSYAQRWKELLDGPLHLLCERLAEDSPDMCAMRQVTPFAGVVPPQQRWAIWRRVKVEQERDPRAA